MEHSIPLGCAGGTDEPHVTPPHQDRVLLAVTRKRVSSQSSLQPSILLERRCPCCHSGLSLVLGLPARVCGRALAQRGQVLPRAGGSTAWWSRGWGKGLQHLALLLCAFRHQELCLAKNHTPGQKKTHHVPEKSWH